MCISRHDRLRLRRAERAVDEMGSVERDVFLANRVDELSYSEIAAKLDISTAEVERHFAASLLVLTETLDRKDPWWWRFWPW